MDASLLTFNDLADLPFSFTAVINLRNLRSFGIFHGHVFIFMQLTFILTFLWDVLISCYIFIREIDILFISPTCSDNGIVGEGHCHIHLTIYVHSLKFISYKVINSSGITMLTSWKLDPYTVTRLNSGRRGDDVLKGGH